MGREVNRVPGSGTDTLEAEGVSAPGGDNRVQEEGVADGALEHLLGRTHEESRQAVLRPCPELRRGYGEVLASSVHAAIASYLVYSVINQN